MEKPNPSRNAALRLPIGFRFRPTDEELLVHYLKRKVCSLPLPASVIPELDVFRTNPWDLPGDLGEKRYFFCSRKEEENGRFKHSIRTGVKDGSGYWKAIGRHRRIIISPAGSNQPIGIKRSLAFYQGKRPNGSRTAWIMDEYYLVASGTNTYSSLLKVGDFIVCCIHRKQRKTKNQSCGKDQKTTATRELIRPPCIWDFTNEDSTHELTPPQASSSFSRCSSGITDVSSNELDQEANSDSNSSKLNIS